MLHGDPSLLDKLPEIQVHQISPWEVRKLYFTRLYTLLACVPDREAWSSGLTGESSRFFNYQLAKAVLAACDALLLTTGAYHWTYRQRVDRIADLPGADADTVTLARWALREKLRPTAGPIDGRQLRERYERVRALFQRHMFAALSCLYGRPITDPGDLERATRTSYGDRLRRLAACIRRTPYQRRIRLGLAQSYLVSAATADAPPEILRRGLHWLSKVDAGVRDDWDWRQARRRVLQLRGEA